MSKSSKAGGCGCGCGGSGGCGCGGKTAAQCVSGDVGCATCNDQGFSRPLFFAGQLLTEEDLQSLGDYVVGKSRLHNRHLFGDGVVCGLEVTCHPCGGGTVVVQPGYALDCCGNDLLLPCPTELDINAMARDLRRSLLGGYDCGDPCADRKKRPEPEPPAPAPTDPPGTPAPTLGMVAPGQSATKGQTVEEPAPETLRHYCLYARYCEEKTDPVSPYATDDGCASQACQPTRVREGVAFELRCRESCESHTDDILERLCACFGDLPVTKENQRSAEHLNTFVRLNTQPQRFYAPTITTADAPRAKANFLSVTGRLRTGPAATTEARVTAEKPQPAANEKEQPAAGETAAAAEQPAEKPVPSRAGAVSAEQLESDVLEIRDAASHLAAFFAASETAGASDEEVAAARRKLLSSTAAARASLQSVPASSPEFLYYTATLDGAEKLARAENPAAELGPVELRAMKSGIVLNERAKVSALQRAQTLREALLDALDASPRVGDCGLRRDVRAVRLPSSEQDAGNEELVAAARALMEAWERYLLDCVCLAFNPSCATCEDTGVLLACLVVDEATCEVVEICNMKRKFVISPTALRYWLPPLKWLGSLVEMFCCEEPLCPDELPVPDRTGRATLSGGTNLSGRLDIGPYVKSRRSGILRLIFLLCDALHGREADEGFSRERLGDRTFREFSRTGSRLMSILGNLRPAAATPGAAVTEESKPSAEFIREAVRDPAMRAELFRAIEPELKKAAPTREELTADIERAVKERIEKSDEAAIERKVEERLAAALSGEGLNTRLAEALKSELVTKVIGEVVGDSAEPAADSAVAAALDKLKLTNVARDLRELKRAKAENAELKKNIEALEKRLNKLEGGT